MDLGYSVPGLGQFRCNIFHQRGTVGRVIGRSGPTDADNRRCQLSAQGEAANAGLSSAAVMTLIYLDPVLLESVATFSWARAAERMPDRP